jgi:hypothetical protein
MNFLLRTLGAYVFLVLFLLIFNCVTSAHAETYLFLADTTSSEYSNFSLQYMDNDENDRLTSVDEVIAGTFSGMTRFSNTYETTYKALHQIPFFDPIASPLTDGAWPEWEFVWVDNPDPQLPFS